MQFVFVSILPFPIFFYSLIFPNIPVIPDIFEIPVIPDILEIPVIPDIQGALLKKFNNVNFGDGFVLLKKVFFYICKK